MTTLSDAIRAAVGGTSINDGLKAYFAANGGVGTTLPDLERSFLLSQLNLASSAASTNDLWRQYLFEFTGSLPDQLLQFWLAGGASTWTPAQWFLAGEQGVWYDPSDFSTMFQDAAGTTPVTAVEQPVGKILDKSGRGNHASQPTTAQKPVLSARKNKLLATTTLATQSVTLTASPHTLSFKGTGTVTLTGASTAGPLVGTGAGNRVSLTFTPTAGSVTFTVSGSVTEAQLEDGSALTTYQRVNTATDYDTVGFPHYLKFDGVDDNLVTGTVAFPLGKRAAAVLGVSGREGPIGSVFTVGNNQYAEDGAYGAFCNATANLDFMASYCAGSATPNGRQVSPQPDQCVVAFRFLVDEVAAADRIAVRVNGAVKPTTLYSPTEGTTGMLGGNKVIQVGARVASTFQKMNLYQLIIRHADTADLAPIESFTAGKMGITL